MRRGPVGTDRRTLSVATGDLACSRLSVETSEKKNEGGLRRGARLCPVGRQDMKTRLKMFTSLPSSLGKSGPIPISDPLSRVVTVTKKTHYNSSWLAFLVSSLPQSMDTLKLHGPNVIHHEPVFEKLVQCFFGVFCFSFAHFIETQVFPGLIDFVI